MPSFIALELALPPPMLVFTGMGAGTLRSSTAASPPAARAQTRASRLAVITSSILSSCWSTVALVWPSTNARVERPPHTSLPSRAR